MGHHYVPKEYLRGFTHPSSPKALWQFDKAKRTFSEKPASIAKIAQQRSFYDEATERDLNLLVEIPGNRVLQKLRSGNLNLSDQDRASLSIYIAAMLKRVPHHRVKAEDLAPKSLAKVSSELREQIRAYVDSGKITPEVAMKRLEETDSAEAKLAADFPPEVREQIRSPWPTKRMVDTIYGMHWRYATCAGGQNFVTTDNPAFYFSCWGLGTDNSELTFPVSSELAIFGSWAPVKNSKEVMQTQFVKEANRRLIKEATRFIFFRSKADWIAKVAAKTQPYLSRIRW